MDFQTFNKRFREFVELAKKGSNIECHLMKDKLGECNGSFSWFMQTYVDQ
jgi:hypothetical protein